MNAAACVRVSVADRRFALAGRTGGQSVGEHAEYETMTAVSADDSTVEVVRRLRRVLQLRRRMHRHFILNAALLHRQIDDLLAVCSRTDNPVGGLETD